MQIKKSKVTIGTLLWKSLEKNFHIKFQFYKKKFEVWGTQLKVKILKTKFKIRVVTFSAKQGKVKKFNFMWKSQGLISFSRKR